MTKKLSIHLLLLTLIAGLLPTFWLAKPVHADNPPVLISEVQFGYTDEFNNEFPLQEFVELTNTTNQRADISHWRVEYLSAANNGSVGATSLLAEMNGHIIPNGHALLTHAGYFPNTPDAVFGDGDISSSGMLAKSGGHVRLMNGSSMVDCVSWGSAVAIDGCDKVSGTTPAKNTIQRLAPSGVFNKSAGVVNASPPTPQGGDLFTDANDPPPPNPVDPPTDPTPLQVCDHIILTEILPNPAGDDAAGEFIEIYNTSDIVQSLHGCQLRLASGKSYDFPLDTTLAPHEYRALPYATTNLQLTNSGTTITLVSAGQVSDVTYPSLGDDEAWALIDNQWVLTKKPTPNQPNALVNGDNQATTTTTTSDSAIVCPVGKERNPATNRCRNIIVAATATPCQPNEERNPATNRCRKISTAASTQKPCDPGQERNPDTNRCRKVEASGKVLASNDTKNKAGIQYHLILIALILAGVGGYALYEYRTDLLMRWRALRRRFIKSKVQN